MGNDMEKCVSCEVGLYDTDEKFPCCQEGCKEMACLTCNTYLTNRIEGARFRCASHSRMVSKGDQRRKKSQEEWDNILPNKD